MWDKVCKFFDTIGSVVIALVRLGFLVLCLTFSGIQIILFTRTEICNIEMKGQPWRCDKNDMDEKLSYVDKLMLENPDLLELANTPLSEEEMRAIEDLDNEEEKDEGDDDDGQSV